MDQNSLYPIILHQIQFCLQIVFSGFLLFSFLVGFVVCFFFSKILGREEFYILILAEGFRMLFQNEVPVEIVFLHVRKQ